MGRELDILVAPFCGPVLTGDEAHPMDASEVAEHERVSGLVSSLAPSVSPRCHSAYSSHECDSKKAFSSSAVGWTSPQLLSRTY